MRSKGLKEKCTAMAALVMCYLHSTAQDGLAGINEADQKVRSYFEPEHYLSLKFSGKFF